MTDSGVVKRIFKLNLQTIRFLGFFPPQRFKYLYKLYAYSVYFCLIIPASVLPAVNLIVGENVDAAQVRDNSFMMFQVGCLIFKLIPFVFYAEEIRQTMDMLEWPIFNKFGIEQEAQIHDCEKICKKFTHLFLGFCAVTVSMWAITPLFGSVRRFPIDIWLPFDATSDVRIFVGTYMFLTTAVCNGAASNGVIDPLASGLIYFAVTQIRILKHNLQCLSSDAEKEIDLNANGNQRFELKNKIMYEKIIDCVKHHTAILKFSKYYEKVFSLVVFAQFMAASIVICLSCWQLSVVDPMTFPFFAMILFVLTMIFEIILYCEFGSTLFEESNSLTNAIYMGPWYEYDIKCKKSLIILMERSKKPIILTVGKILDLSLGTFTTILRRAYSLLAVLKNY